MSFTHAQTIEEALNAIAAGAKPIAGGSDLVVGARQGKTGLPESLVAIESIDEMRNIEETESGLRIGACVTHAELMDHPEIVGNYTAIADAAALVGSPATRNVGTLGGNVMNASPAMDSGAPLLVLGGQAVLQSLNGSRTLDLGDLWSGPGETSAAGDELCVAVEVPTPSNNSGSAYIRLEYRRAMEIAVVGAAASVTLANGAVAEARVALTAVAPTIVEANVSDLVKGLSVEAAAAAVQDAASEAASPISDLRASDQYRRHTVGVMARRAVEAAAARATGEKIGVPVNRSIGIGAAG